MRCLTVKHVSLLACVFGMIGLTVFYESLAQSNKQALAHTPIPAPIPVPFQHSIISTPQFHCSDCGCPIIPRKSGSNAKPIQSQHQSKESKHSNSVPILYPFSLTPSPSSAKALCQSQSQSQSHDSTSLYVWCVRCPLHRQCVSCFLKKGHPLHPQW